MNHYSPQHLKCLGQIPSLKVYTCLVGVWDIIIAMSNIFTVDGKISNKTVNESVTVTVSEF